MRKLLFLCLLAAVFSCNDNEPEQDIVTRDTTIFMQDSILPSGIEDRVRFKNLIWLPVFDSAKGDVTVKQQRPVSADTLTADKLIKEINGSWDGIELVFRKISHDTIYVAIPESSFLTQQMGSSGAFSYMSSTTYTLTELKDIKFVNYDFEEGDHLAPGTLKRTDFEN